MKSSYTLRISNDAKVAIKVGEFDRGGRTRVPTEALDHDFKEVNFSETRFYQDVLQKGLEQGLEQGLQRGEADLVLRLLQRRCGVLGVDRQELIRSLPIAQLELLGEALLDFTNMADLEIWLDAADSVP